MKLRSYKSHESEVYKEKKVFNTFETKINS